jgi:hypothetical protein
MPLVKTYKLVGLNVLLLDLNPLRTQTQLGSLELQIGVLSTRHLVVKDTRVRSADIGLEALVKHSDLGPVRVEGLNVFVRDTRAETGLLERDTDGTHGGLRGETGEV